MKYVNFDNDGRILGFYSDEINKVIPATAKPIDDEQWVFLLSNNGRYKIDKTKVTDKVDKSECFEALELPPSKPIVTIEDLLKRIDALEAEVKALKK